MHSLSIVGNQPKIFGYLYVAVFSNGTVKAGRSARDPQGRVTTHANSGKAFDIHLDSAFYASVYTNDVSTRERLMHQEIGLKARLTAGKEWFKFGSAASAVNFASAYLCKVERMSFAERPSAEEIALQNKSSGKALDFLFGSAFSPPAQSFVLPNPANESELAELASVMSEYSLPVLASIASKIVSLEEQAADLSHGGGSQTPALTEVINAHFAEIDRICEMNGMLPSSTDEARIHEITEQGSTYTKDDAVKIIQAAAGYPAFFYEAMGFKVVA